MTAHARPQIALAHDVLAVRAGGARVLNALAGHWPDAPIHTLVFEPSATFDDLSGHDVRPSWLQSFAPLRTRYRATLPVAALTWSARTIDADVTICSTAGFSHHVRTTGACIAYCHTPARWIHQPDVYLDGYGPGVRAAAAVLLGPLGWLDRRAMRSVDLVLANSHQIADEIAAIYDIAARVVAPCSTLDMYGPVHPIEGIEPGFVLTPMRLLAYKRFDVLVAAAKRRPNERFLQVGDGPHRHQMLADAPSNLVSVGSITDSQLRWAYANARVAALTCAEDFGLVPLEAAAFGLGTVAPLARGVRDHDPATIVGYAHGSVDEFVAALDSAPAPSGIRDPDRLGLTRFLNEIDQAIDDVLRPAWSRL